MRFHTYTKFNPQLADAVDMQALLDQLADYLLQSGFAGGGQNFWGEPNDEADRSLEGLKAAMLQALDRVGANHPRDVGSAAWRW